MKIEEVIVGIKQDRFRVIGEDRFDRGYFIVGDDYESFREARAITRIKTKEEEKLNGKDNEISNRFFVVDSYKKIYISEAKILGEEI